MTSFRNFAKKKKKIDALAMFAQKKIIERHKPVAKKSNIRNR